MRILVKITDEDIRYNVENAIKECTENDWISVPEASAMEEFIQDCVQQVVDNYETSEYYPRPYVPDYTDIVMDNAKWDGYMTEGGE